MTKLTSQKKKATIGELQEFTGYLNFLCKAIYPGRAFTRRMYSKIPWTSAKGVPLKQHYHASLDAEFRKDCLVWLTFLEKQVTNTICRPFVDFTVTHTAHKLNFFTDSSANPRLGFGGFYANRWFAGRWGEEFIWQKSSSISYLELYAIAMAIKLWAKHLQNCRVEIFTNNQMAMRVLNDSSSGCKNSMVLVRIIVLTELQYNVCFFAQYVKGHKNGTADDLSHGKIWKFLRESPWAHERAETIHHRHQLFQPQL